MPGRIVVVVGAVGGVGASTVAAMVSSGLARRGRDVALVDADPSHGGIEVLLGSEGQRGARWPDLSGVRAVIDVADLTGVLPRWRGVEVLSADRRGGMPLAAAQAVLESLVGAREHVVIDLPGHHLVSPDPFVAGLVETASDVVVVTGQDVLGVCGAVMIREAAGRRAVLVLRRRRRARVAPAEAAAVLGLRVAALLPSDRCLGEAVDLGVGPRPGPRYARSVARLCRGLDSG